MGNPGGEESEKETQGAYLEGDGERQRGGGACSLAKRDACKVSKKNGDLLSVLSNTPCEGKIRKKNVREGKKRLKSLWWEWRPVLPKKKGDSLQCVDCRHINMKRGGGKL